MSAAEHPGTDTPRVSHEELTRLVAELRSVIAQHEQTLARQAAAIQRLQSAQDGLPLEVEIAVPGSSRTLDPEGSAPSRAAQPAAPPTRPAARREPGSDFTIVFDGGSLGNPGRGYGSYQIVGPDGVVANQRREYGDRVTNNQAEYQTLIHALEDLSARLGAELRQTSVAVRGDSKLVIEQVTGRWKVKHPELQPLHRRAAELLRGFARADVAWHRRDHSVRVLGH